MRSVDRIDMNKRRPIPSWTKFLLLIMIIFGISLRNCWKKSQSSNITISDIYISEYTISTVDVKFTVENPHEVALSKPIMIRIILNSGEELTSKLASIEFAPQSRKTYLKVLTKLSQPLADLTEIDQVTVEVYNP